MILTQEQEMIRDAMRDFAQERLAPFAGEWDRHHTFPAEARFADPAQRAVGLEALSRWPDATVKDRLLELLAATGDEKERDVLLGTLIRIAPLPNNTLDDKQKLELLRRTMDLCRRDEDRRRVLERANAIRTVDTHG